MRLRTAFRWVVFTGLATSLLHVITVAVLPWLVMFRVQEAAGDVWGYNRMTRVEAVDAETRFIPRPDPHMAYSVCPFDLSKGPLRVIYGAMADHASVTAYGGDTENFLTIAGAELSPGEVVLATPEQAARALATDPGTLMLLEDRWKPLLERHWDSPPRLVERARLSYFNYNRGDMETAAIVTPEDPRWAACGG